MLDRWCFETKRFCCCCFGFLHGIFGLGNCDFNFGYVLDEKEYEMKSIPKIERELMRGAGPIAVMQLLSSRGEMYGYELVEALEKKTENILAMGQSTLYPMLYNLEAKGFVESEQKLSDSGRKRKYYTLTKKGIKRLARDTEQWVAVSRALSLLGVEGGAV